MAKSTSRRRRRGADAGALLNLAIGKWRAQAISVAAELGIADILEDGARTVAEIAREVNASEDGLYRLLRALESLCLFVESRGRRFRLTPLGALLRTDGPDGFGGMVRFIGHESTWRPWGELRYSVRTAEPAFDHVFQMPVFEYFARTPDAAAVFNQAMTSLSTWEAGAVVEAYSFSRVKTLVDVAGGHGLLLATILKASRTARGILIDLPQVATGARTLLEREGVADRSEVVEGDMFAGVPAGGDAYIMKHIIHDWDDERALRILDNCRRAMHRNAKVLIVDAVIGSRNAGAYGKFLDLEMLVLTPRGRERTQSEFAALLQRAGLRLRRVVPTRMYLSIVEAVAK